MFQCNLLIFNVFLKIMFLATGLTLEHRRCSKSIWVTRPYEKQKKNNNNSNFFPFINTTHILQQHTTRVMYPRVCNICHSWNFMLMPLCCKRPAAVISNINFFTSCFLFKVNVMQKKIRKDHYYLLCTKEKMGDQNHIRCQTFFVHVWLIVVDHRASPYCPSFKSFDYNKDFQTLAKTSSGLKTL